MKQIAILFILLTFLGAGCTRFSSQNNTPVGSSRFGQVVNEVSALKPIDGGWVRLNPGPFWWDKIETSQDVYDWSVTDQTVTDLQNQNQALLVTLWPFAQWDQERCHATEPKMKDPFGDQEIRMMSVCHVDSYEEWVANVTERYDGDGIDDMPGLKYPITHWEIASEPDVHEEGRTYFQYSPVAYDELYRLAYDVIKKADPNATVMFGGMSSMSGSAKIFWKEILDVEKDRADVFNIHSRAVSDQFFSKEYHEWLDSLGFVEKPYWITEALPGSVFVEREEDFNAQITMTGYAQAFANGAQRIFHVATGDKSDQTFKTVVNMIDGFETAEWVGKESMIKFTFPNKDVYAMWDGGKLPLLVQGKVETVTYDGAKKRVDAREVLASEPTFVVVKK